MRVAGEAINVEASIKDLHELNILDTPLNKNFERITRVTKALYDVPIVAISLLDEERQWFKSAQGLDVCETTKEVSFCSYTVLQDDLLIVNDTLKDERFVDHPYVTGSPHIRFYAGYPLKSKNGNNIGALCIVDFKPRNYTAEELTDLVDMAGLTENALLNQTNKYLQSELIQELDDSKRKNLIDPLTKIWNRAGIETVLFKQLALSRSQEKGFGLALADIDNFKDINDTYGHITGDEALKHVSKIFIDALRENDAVGRWGGEEFLIVADVPDKEVLKKIIERLRIKLQNSPLLYDDKKIHITVTIGLIFVDPTNNQTISALVDTADQALYKGKNGGKNKVVFLE